MSKTVTTKCSFCEKPFEAQLRELKRGNAKYCSRSCSSRSKVRKIISPTPNVKCAFCGKEFYKNNTKIKASKHSIYFCCRKHKDFAQRIGGIKEIQPLHYGTGASEYRKKALESFPLICNRCGFKQEPGILVVHHRDRNRLNGKLENLEILCPNCHLTDHYLAQDGLYHH